MLTREQKNVIEELVRDTVAALNTKYETSLPNKEDAAQAVKSILESILSVTTRKMRDELLETYRDDKESIRLLVELRFANTAFAALNSKQLFLPSQGEAIAGVAGASLHGCLEFQKNIVIAAVQVKATRENTKLLKEENEKGRAKVEKQKKGLRFRVGNISEEEREVWINESSFSVELKNVQQVIERLDSRFVFDGKDKATYCLIHQNH